MIWVGIKMALKIDLYYIPTTISLAVIALVIGTSVALSLRATRGQTREDKPSEVAPSPFRVATETELAEAAPVWGTARRGGRGRS